MEKDHFLQQVKQQFVDAEEIELTFDSNFRKIDSYDSLTGMSILVMIKDEYQQDIPEDVFKQQKTVAELYELVKSLLG